MQQLAVNAGCLCGMQVLQLGCTICICVLWGLRLLVWACTGVNTGQVCVTELLALTSC
jgi:hypothetical protein